MASRRDCVHEAGHFYVAFMYRTPRAVSIYMLSKAQTDPLTREEYRSVGHAVTFDPLDGNPRVQVSIRAAGLAAESIVYNESFEELMANPAVRFRIKTDTDNAKCDLGRAGLPVSGDEEFVSFYWRPAFDDAVIMLRSSQQKLNRIADYCRANPDREITKAELTTNCDL